MTNVRAALAMLGVGALLGAVAVPFVCVVLFMQSRAEPNLRAETYGADETIERLPGSSGSDVWALPTDLDRDQVTCTGNDLSGKRPRQLTIGPPEDGPARAADGRGTFTFLTVAGDDLSTTNVTCSGGGLTTVAISDHVDRATYRHLAFGLPAAIPVLLAIAWAIRRFRADG